MPADAGGHEDATEYPVTNEKMRGSLGTGDASNGWEDSEERGGGNEVTSFMLVAVVGIFTMVTVCILLVALAKRKRKYQRAKSASGGSGADGDLGADSSVDMEVYPAFSDVSGELVRLVLIIL